MARDESKTALKSVNLEPKRSTLKIDTILLLFIAVIAILTQEYS